LQRLLFEALPRAYPTLHLDYLTELRAERRGPRLLVASALDGGCGDRWDDRCRAALAELVARACPENASGESGHGGEGGRGGGATCLVAVACGEAWDMSALDVVLPPRPGLRVLLLPASVDPALLPKRWPWLHLPVAASSFGERAEVGLVRSLLGAADFSGDGADSQFTSPTSARPHFCAHLYYRCDRPARERFVELLRAAAIAAAVAWPPGQEPRTPREVVALGACDGRVGQAAGGQDVVDETKARRGSFRERRFGDGWHDAAVALYGTYRFVVCFENAASRGYVTEKVVNAMLAGAIPIYWGAPDAAAYFNPRAMVNCADYAPADAPGDLFVGGSGVAEATLAACAAAVVTLDGDSVRLAAMRQQPRVLQGNLPALFQWLPGVGEEFVDGKDAQSFGTLVGSFRLLLAGADTAFSYA
jgi:hypothetical protein